MCDPYSTSLSFQRMLPSYFNKAKRTLFRLSPRKR